MKNDFDKILDECIDRINRGEGAESTLANYPDYADQLRPLIQAMLAAKEAYSFVPSPSTKKAARERFNTALKVHEQSQAERQSWFVGLPGWSKGWATAIAVILIAVIGFFVMKPVLFPGEAGIPTTPSTATSDSPPELPRTVMVAQPNPEGNFVFLISDDVNAISDFDSVNVSISKISLRKRDDSDQLVEFEPELREVDLTLVQGDKTREIWRGNIPEGEYTNASIEVSDVRGVLKDTDKEVEIKLPSQKLHISKRFQVGADILTTFTYDLTVVATGSPKSGITYILKPQVDQSGADYKSIEPKDKAKK